MTYDTDKTLLGYIPQYSQIASELGPAARVLELGVLNGLGLEMLQDMYPDGIVAGVDFNPASRWPEGAIRIVLGQSDPSLPSVLNQYAWQWDLIVDDASHRGDLTAATFEMLWPLVSPGGYYVIEDWFIGCPLWPSTGCWDGAPVGSAAVADSYDPGLLRVVQRLPVMLDKPYPGVGAPADRAPGGDVESVLFRYGLVIVRKKCSI